MMVGAHLPKHRREGTRENDVAVDVTDDIVARDLLTSTKHIVESFGAERIAIHVGFVMKAELAGDFGCSGVVPKKNHFNPWIKQSPTLQRVPLDDATVPLKGFGRCAERKHNKLLIPYSHLSCRSLRLQNPLFSAIADSRCVFAPRRATQMS